MPERPEVGSKTNPEAPLSVEVGQTFKPFEGLGSLTSPNDRIDYLDSVYYSDFREITIEGATFSLALVVEEDMYQPNFRYGFETPLGTPSVEYDLLTRSEWVCRKTPLTIAALAVLETRMEYDTLRDHKLRLKLGGEFFELDCVEELDEGDLEDRFDGRESWLLSELDGVVLPFDIEKISQIEATIVAKDKFIPSFENTT